MFSTYTGQVVGCQYKKHDQSQQQQHQRQADAGRDELHVKIGYRVLLVFIGHCFISVIVLASRSFPSAGIRHFFLNT